MGVPEMSTGWWEVDYEGVGGVLESGRVVETFCLLMSVIGR